MQNMDNEVNRSITFGATLSPYFDHVLRKYIYKSTEVRALRSVKLVSVVI